MPKEAEGYTAGEFARIAGITPRMLRHYDKIGLLVPEARTPGGYRLYGETSLIRLQKIMMLRYLGFSLEQTATILRRDDGQQLAESLKEQQRLLQAQRRHIDRLLEALRAAMLQEGKSQSWWDALAQIMRLTQRRQRIMERYEDTRLRQRASRIHRLYSQNPYGWYRWLFDRLSLRPGERVAVCYALWDDVWLQNAERIPRDTKIEIFDCVEYNLEKSRESLAACRFAEGVAFRHTLWEDENADLETGRYDLIVANQLFIHAHDLTDFFLTLHGALKPGGRLCCVAMGQNHMKELMELTQAFEPRFMNDNREFNSRFSLENGAKQLETLFRRATAYTYDDALLVPDAGSICDYLYGVYTNASEVLAGRRSALYDYYASLLKRGPLYVTKAQGIIEAAKADPRP